MFSTVITTRTMIHRHLHHSIESAEALLAGVAVVKLQETWSISRENAGMVSIEEGDI